MWSEILIILSAALGFTYILSSFEGKNRDIKSVSLVTLSLIIVFQINGLLAYSTKEPVAGFLSLSLFCSALIFLLLSIRRLKPAFARYPYAISFLPVFIVALYPIMIENNAIVHLVLQLIQAAGIAAYLMVLFAHVEEKRLVIYTSVSGVFLVGAYLLFWPLGDLVVVGRWLWQSLVAISILLLSYSVTKIFNKLSFAS